MSKTNKKKIRAYRRRSKKAVKQQKSTMVIPVQEELKTQEKRKTQEEVERQEWFLKTDMKFDIALLQEEIKKAMRQIAEESEKTEKSKGAEEVENAMKDTAKEED